MQKKRRAVPMRVDLTKRTKKIIEIVPQKKLLSKTEVTNQRKSWHTEKSLSQKERNRPIIFSPNQKI